MEIIIRRLLVKKNKPPSNIVEPGRGKNNTFE